ncbi:MAG: FAD:protein FMN transferase [Pseudomonadota bacterium]
MDGPHANAGAAQARRVILPARIGAPTAPAGMPVRVLRGETMGTTWCVRAVEGGAAVRLQEALQAQLDMVVAQMSHWRADSALSRFNAGPAGSWHSLPPALFEVLAFANDVARDSGGAYDPGAGALVNAWGFGPYGRFDQPDFRAPTPRQIALLLARRGGRPIALEAATRRACQPGGVLLDLSSVAKGYGVDLLAHYLEQLGVRHYLVEVGGELRGAGTKPDGQPWWVGLEPVTADSTADTHRGDTPAPMVVALHGLSVATSGDYRRFFLRDGVRYSHTIDPRRALPIDHQLASVTVIHPQCMAADAWSTALTVLGPQAGLALAESAGLAARFLVRRGAGLVEVTSSHLTRMLAP